MDAEDCHLASAANNARRNEVREWAREAGIPAYDRRTGTGVLRNLVVRRAAAAASPDPPRHLAGRDPAPAGGPAHGRRGGPGGGTDGPTGALGPEYLTERLGDLKFRISHRAFFQTNTEMAERLYAAAARMADLKGTERLFDLYCGIGTLTLTMAARAGEVWGIEVVADAVADAAENARLNGIGNAHFRAGDARKAIRPLLEEAGRPDVVVVDPPRAGLSAKIVRRLIECEADRIVYVSCNPTTLAPNAAQLAEAGYRLRRVKPVDMFPQTPHIECVALLEREAS